MKKDPSKDRQYKAPGAPRDTDRKPDAGTQDKKKDRPESKQEPVSRF